jgi:hypothetical protein
MYVLQATLVEGWKTTGSCFTPTSIQGCKVRVQVRVGVGRRVGIRVVMNVRAGMLVRTKEKGPSMVVGRGSVSVWLGWIEVCDMRHLRDTHFEYLSLWNY